MFIHIVPGRHVAGVFADRTRSDAYLAQAGAHETRLVEADVSYPFVIVETADREFHVHQDEDSARARPGDAILFFIEGDYEPEVPWTDRMGSLDHRHVGAFGEADDEDGGDGGADVA